MASRRWIFAINLVRGLVQATKPLAGPILAVPRGGFSAAHEFAKKAVAGVLALTFPDDCRICGDRLTGFPPYPVCASCLSFPEPLSAEAFCSQCYAPFHSRSALDLDGRCRFCRAGITHFDALYCVGAYEGRLRELIHLFKYGPMQRLKKPLGAFLRSGMPLEARFDILVPMPVHASRLRQRGFNQAELLAREVAKPGSLTVANLLVRTRKTKPQADLTSSQRRLNVRNAFRATDPSRLAGKRILLVDDVVTSASSANACALTLKQSGASYVAVLAVARADRRWGAGPEAAGALSNFSGAAR